MEQGLIMFKKTLYKLFVLEQIANIQLDDVWERIILHLKKYLKNNNINTDDIDWNNLQEIIDKINRSIVYEGYRNKLIKWYDTGYIFDENIYHFIPFYEKSDTENFIIKNKDCKIECKNKKLLAKNDKGEIVDSININYLKLDKKLLKKEIKFFKSINNVKIEKIFAFKEKGKLIINIITPQKLPEVKEIKSVSKINDKFYYKAEIS